jgi:hypothetical protein
MTDGTPEVPWQLKTPPLTSEYLAWFDVAGNVPVLAVQVGKNLLHYDRECIDDLRDMLVDAGDWVELGSADEQKDARPGTVEAWARSADNPKGGWYGLKKGLRGRFAMYVPPVMERLGLAEVEHNPRGNRMRAVIPSPGVSPVVRALNEPEN